jgi:hypothetical protein
MGGGMMGGMMSVAPEQVAQFKVGTVCLEHGKKDPRPSVKYEIKPIESFTAAAWNLTDGLTWEQLAAKRAVHVNGVGRQWFSPQQVQAGMQLAHHATIRAEEEEEAAKEKAKDKSPGETESSSDEVIGRIE